MAAFIRKKNSTPRTTRPAGRLCRTTHRSRTAIRNFFFFFVGGGGGGGGGFFFGFFCVCVWFSCVLLCVAVGRAAARHDRDRELPHRRSRRSPGGVRRLWSSTRVLQLVPPQGLPEVSGSRTRQMARGPSGGTARRALLPRGVHRAVGDRGHRVPEPGRGLRHPVPGGLRDVAEDRRRPKASGRGDRLPRRAAHLGTIPPTSPAHSFSRSWRWHRTRWRQLDRLPTRILSAGHGVVVDVSRPVPALPDEGVRRRRAEILLRTPPPQ